MVKLNQIMLRLGELQLSAPDILYNFKKFKAILEFLSEYLSN